MTTSTAISASTRSRWIFWASVAGLYLALFSALGVATQARASGSFGTALLGFLAVGWLQYVLIQAMHEACHQARSGVENSLAGVLLFHAIGLPRAYRRIHFSHHAVFNTPQDPDYPAYANFPRSRAALLRTLLGHATGWAAARQILEQSVGETGERHPSPLGDRLGMPLVQLTLLAAFTWLASPFDYFFFWLLPIVTVAKVLGYLRILAEHGHPSETAALRSFRCNPAVGAILGPYGFARHAEHHAWSNVPFSRLSDYSGEDRRAPIESYAAKHGAVVDIFEGSHFRLLNRWWKELPNRVAG